MSGGEPSCAIVVRDRRVLVTAGASGIGRAVAAAFAGAGAKVHVNDIDDCAIGDAVSGILDLGGTAGDAPPPKDVDGAVADLRTRLGGLDVLVDNVGVAGPTGRTEDYTDGAVERTIDVNLEAHFYFLNRRLPLLRVSRRNPRVIAMSSMAGRLGYGFRALRGDQMGEGRFGKVARGRTRPNGVRPSAVLPGMVKGPRMDRVIADRARAEGGSFEAMRHSCLSKISLRRTVETEDAWPTSPCSFPPTWPATSPVKR